MALKLDARQLRRMFICCCCLIALSACGTMRNKSNANEQAVAGEFPVDEKTDSAHDPFEGFNRAMYVFNDKFDQFVFKPLAKGYRAITPEPVSKSISNFFSNLRDPIVMLNNLLQGKPDKAASDLSRIMINTTFGIFGLFDVSTKMGLRKNNEDFGQTLAVWGVGDGPYLVLPFLGPSSVRDGLALPADWVAYPPNNMEERSTASKLLLVEVIDRRAQLLEASDILAQAAGDDPYTFVREAYRQRRRNLVYDGNPPQAAPPPGLFEEDEPAPQGSSAPSAGP